jgi:hypothetical protein
MYNIQIRSFFLGFCPSCNRYISTKTLRFGSRLCSRLQTISTQSFGPLRLSFSQSLCTTRTLRLIVKLLTAELVLAFQALFFESRGCALPFLQQFPVISHGQFLISGAYLHVLSFTVAASWARVAWSKGSNSLGASGLKTEAELASEM